MHVYAQVVRRIDVPVREVMWAESGELVTIVSQSSFFVLRFDRPALEAFAESGQEAPEEGVEDSFELLNEVSEVVRTGACWGGALCVSNGGHVFHLCT